MDDKECKKKQVTEEVPVDTKTECIEREDIGESCSTEIVAEKKTKETDECDDSGPKYIDGKKKE